uniref:Uncharacterized protein n=1 Tax=Nelumbo nucifera TaxID=4432 RepID=A0A822XLN1_NELNU|nr:TPA_asm: hypothetical protein HUJ06_022086 [Nelumbo nucifera]
MKGRLKALLVDRITKEIRANTFQRPSSSKKNLNLNCDRPDPSPSAIQQGSRMDVTLAIALSKRKAELYQKIRVLIPPNQASVRHYLLRRLQFFMLRTHFQLLIHQLICQHCTIQKEVGIIPENQGVNSAKSGKCSPLPSSSVTILHVEDTFPIANSPTDLSTSSPMAESMEIDANHIQTGPATNYLTPCKHIQQIDVANTITSALHLVGKVNGSKK